MDEALLDVITDELNERGIACDPLRFGPATFNLTATDDIGVFVKIARTEVGASGRLGHELDAVRLAQRHQYLTGIKTPTPLIGAPVFVTDPSTGKPRQVSVWEQLPVVDAPPLMQQVKAAVWASARIAKIGTIWSARPGWNYDEVIERVRRRTTASGAACGTDLLALAQTARDALAAKNPPLSWGHCDLHLQNLIWFERADRRIPGVVVADWECAGLMAIEMDLAQILRSIWTAHNDEPLGVRETATCTVIELAEEYFPVNEARPRGVDWMLVRDLGRIRGASHASRLLVDDDPALDDVVWFLNEDPLDDFLPGLGFGRKSA